ncbi:glycosyltransferase family 4 protein [Oceanobacillus damuensis]|uniref:glycosyltransferase family 4 protein n=1 Tax=Oceanobacillus damuensis TaxID=937928 RepID=UPI00082AD15D|nr:glycosyltransferase family 4 protein [Oceanobacillus damuensis]
MKILITTECYSPVINGVVTSVVNLHQELNNLGHDVRILTLSGKLRSVENDGVTYIGSLGIDKIYPGARVALTTENIYLKSLMEWKPDVIHSQSEFSTFQMARHIAKKLHIPIVHTYHTIYEDYTHYFSPNKKWGKAMAARFTKSILKNTECVIVPTDKVRCLLEGYGVNQQLHVVPTGVNLGLYVKEIESTEKEKLRDMIGIPNNNKVLISVGRLAKEKNLEEILRFLSILRTSNITLLIVGDGPHRSFLEKFVSELGLSEKVIFTGMVLPEELSAYYQLGDVFVSASNSETQGLTYLEALANGIPALCRKDPCLEKVIVDGVNGWQFSSYEEFVKGLETLLENRDFISQNARLDIISNYSSAAFVKKVEKIYRNAIQQYKGKEKELLPSR